MQTEDVAEDVTEEVVSSDESTIGAVRKRSRKQISDDDDESPKTPETEEIMKPPKVWKFQISV